MLTLQVITEIRAATARREYIQAYIIAAKEMGLHHLVVDFRVVQGDMAIYGAKTEDMVKRQQWCYHVLLNAARKLLRPSNFADLRDSLRPSDLELQATVPA